MNLFYSFNFIYFDSRSHGMEHKQNKQYNNNKTVAHSMVTVQQKGIVLGFWEINVFTSFLRVR